ncbi:hypothetical protein BDW69DRAFT_178951 [Aspergillus filifer]
MRSWTHTRQAMIGILPSPTSHQTSELSFATTFYMTYNSHTRKLIARIAKPNIFDIPRQWLNIEMEKMLKSDFLSRVEKSQLAGWDWLRSVYFDFFTGPYTDSRKSASWHLTPNSPPNRLPSIVAQTGWAEDLPNLLEDMELWLQGGYPHVKLVLLFAWSEQEESTACEIGVYERTSAGTTRERFHATVPPHTGDVEEHSGIPIMRSDLFGACDVPTECNPADIYNFSPARLRGLRIQREQEGKRERLKQRMNTLREMMYDSDGLGGGEE